MSGRPHAELAPNSWEFENEALIKPTGFREYDARWWFGHSGSDRPSDLNLYGVQALGLGLGTLIHELGVEPKIVVGHDFRSYSLSVKQALEVGLMAAGVEVHDIGLALSPTAYFAQFDLDIPCVAMVTASHNSNGWTGVKMGAARPLTFGPDEMSRLKEIVLGGLGQHRAGGGYVREQGVAERFIADVADGVDIKRPLKVVAACGNGTAGAFVPQALRAMGVEVIEMDCHLDHTFPRYNPNPEDMKMLHAIRDAVLEHGADVGLGFDGDGDRCGVIDNEGEEIFADKIGLMLARDLAPLYPGAKFVVDVKSTGLFAIDPVLAEHGCETDYYKTGHSYIKRRSKELGALAGFEKSGHFFLQDPIGRGYDDGMVAARAVLQMLDRNPDKSMADLRRALPVSYGSPTMSPACADEVKYGVIDRIVAEYQAKADQGVTVAGRKIAAVNTVNGVRFSLDDGAWGLVRASSNTPNLVVVVESPNSADDVTMIFNEIATILDGYEEIGEFDQKV
ncbi:MAG: phosphomannomutase/phosphoglucomutase [Maricaulis sp.]|uniref:phosphomannomutase/phosphoglucomutase n=1 Tax=Maricaulis sp. TaxID=1486257 RepID=UPI001B0F6B02|nr:phosphomannomutase/phosphoglucomutase [Maricaulis sp.]MBO6728429.1 phosphomannomutase/phosphoglucomutase [Maricaulis sp.]MBO6848420.1 phosphomannomutase/phosphoglucomutase [Maricaulis sp.]MBO6878208.1 phosphomannomutase/phosphoglucomutase [Maricaulis sp.]